MTAIIFLLVLSVLVLVHEVGHFVMAKRAGMKVEEFGFGFPPRLWGYKPKNSETTYTINWIPFGGFVKIFGENGMDSEEAEKHPDGTRGFATKSFMSRASVIVAGVAMNFILAALILVITSGVGARVSVQEDNIPKNADDIKIQITKIVKGGPAEMSGLLVLDEILGFSRVDEVQSYILENVGEETIIKISRNGEVMDIDVVPRVNPPEGEGALGIGLSKTAYVSYPWHQAFIRGVKQSGIGFWAIVKGFGTVLGNLLTTGKAGVDLAGPVGIAVITRQEAQFGFIYLLQFIAFLSLNLAVINLFPFPGLDGGRLLFLIIEKIKGSPLPQRIEAGFNSIGFVLLLGLMFFITVKDVLKFL